MTLYDNRLYRIEEENYGAPAWRILIDFALWVLVIAMIIDWWLNPTTLTQYAVMVGCSIILAVRLTRGV